MKFLFYIAYLVCVSSLPISSLPERHLKPITPSLVGLRTATEDYTQVATDKYCSGNRLSWTSCHADCADYAADWPWGSNEQCAQSCTDNPDCKFYLWNDNTGCDCCNDMFSCATFESCGITSTYQDGDGSNIYRKFPGEVESNYEYVSDSADNDKYCCSNNCNEAVILDTHCIPTQGCDLDQPSALWYSKENCESSCSSDPTCSHYLWRQDNNAVAKKTCATFNNCDSKSAFNDGWGGCIYEKLEDHYVAKGSGNPDRKCTQGIMLDDGWQNSVEDWPVDDSQCDSQLVSDGETYPIVCCSEDDIRSEEPFMASPWEDQTFPACVASAHFNSTDKTRTADYVIYQKKKLYIMAPNTKLIQEGCMSGTWSEAQAQCASVGGALCTRDQLSSNCADQTGCWYDQRLVWTSDSS